MQRGIGQTHLPWNTWWVQNRAPYLRLRARIRERTVLTGRTKTGELFNRKALRDTTLAPLMLRALHDRDEEVRTSAAVALGKFGSPAAVPLLLDLSRRDGVKQVREAAMIGLMLVRRPELRDGFRTRVLDRKDERRMRCFAVVGLGFLKDDAFLIDVLTGKQALGGPASTVDEIRACAALALGFSGAERSVAPLGSVALDKNGVRGARGYAGCAMGRLGHPLGLPDMQSLLRDGGALGQARCGAAIAVGGFVRPGDSAVVDFCGRKSLRDRDSAVRVLLTISLGRIGGDRAVTHITAGLKGNDSRVRSYSYLALGISGHADAGDLLAARFEHLKNPDERGACALGLGLSGHKASVAMLRKRLERGNPAFVPHGMVALGLLDDPKAIPLVQAILKDRRDPVTRREGAIALALLRRSGAVPELVELLRNASSVSTRGAVAEALGLVGNANAIGPLMEIFRDERRQGEERAIALAAMGRIADPEDIPLLARLAFDLNPYVVSDAISELLTIL